MKTKKAGKAGKKVAWWRDLPTAECCPQCGSGERFWADLGLGKSPVKVPYAECLDCGTLYLVPPQDSPFFPRSR